MTSATTDAAGREGRPLALVAQLSILLNGLLLTPLLIRVTAGKTNVFVRFHATEALNLHLVLVGWMLAFIPISTLFPGWSLLWLAVYVSGFLYAIVVGIVGGIRGWRGSSWRYPINIRFMSA